MSNTPVDVKLTAKDVLTDQLQLVEKEIQILTARLKAHEDGITSTRVKLHQMRDTAGAFRFVIDKLENGLVDAPA